MKILPQVIYLLLIFMSFGVHLAKHGASKGNHNVLIFLFDASVTLLILWWGGFFDGLLNVLS